MSVELDPPELGFKRPFTSEVKEVLRLHNPNSDSVAFKVKTTAPKQYCVRPNSGRIEAGQQVEVEVLLQAMKEDPPPDTKCRDKFLVQSVAINADNTAADSSVSQIWSNIEQTAKGSIQEKKIRVNFLPADGATTSDSSVPAAAAAGGAAAAGAAGAAAVTNGITSHEDSPPAYSSPSPPSTTPQRSSAVSDVADTTTTTAVGDTSTLGTSIPTTQEDLKAQLEQARAEISRLQSQAAESIRQRKPQETAEKAIASAQQSLQNAPAPGGVPIQHVALLCLVAFLIAWLFF